MLRKLSMAAILAGAVGVPYAVWNGNQALDVAGSWLGNKSDETAGEKPKAPAAQPVSRTSGSNAFASQPRNYYDPTAVGSEQIYEADALSGSASAANGYYSPATLTGPTETHLAELFRMDISPDWVTGRFTRVTTTLADTGYAGLRVPVVSGLNEWDVTGSLTYYFDRQQRLQRMTFHGTTGDPRHIASFLTQQFQLEQRQCLGGELYTRAWMNRTDSVCRIRPASVINTAATNTRYEVLVEINRSQWKSSLSPTAKQLLE